VTVRRLLAIAALLAAACSGNGFNLAHQTYDGSAGAPIEVELVGGELTVSEYGRGIPQQAELQFLVSNNSDTTHTIKRIQVFQQGSGPVAIESGYGGAGTTIEPGHDATITVRANVTQVARAEIGGNVRSVVIRADVLLENDDSYAYSFEVPVGISVR
jgi:hypothetical protein